MTTQVRNTRSSSKTCSEQQKGEEETFVEKIWCKLESKLNGWIQESLPKLAKEILEKKLTEAVELCISSESFKASLIDSFNFDVKQLEENVEQNSKNLSKLQSADQNLEFEMNHLMSKCKTLEEHCDHLEQYTRRTNIRIFGIPENTRENTDDLVKSFCKDHLNIELKNGDISRSHRLGKPKLYNNRSHSRPIIVRLVQHNKKVEILKQRRLLRSKQIPYSVQEDLTEKRRSIVRYLRDEDVRDVISKVWTIDVVIFFRPSSDPTIVERCNTLGECQQLVAKYCDN